MKIQDGQTLLCIGDSITDCGRARPVGANYGAGLGGGYVNLAHALITASHPDRHIRVLNTGISGNRVTDLESRWEADVLAHEPDWLTILIGINDVWRHFDSPGIPQVNEATFTATLQRLVERTAPSVSGIILMTPFYLETNRDDPMRKQMDHYGAAVKSVATQANALPVDVQAAFDTWLAGQPTQLLCGDRVHPNTTGHMIIARALVKALGLVW